MHCWFDLVGEEEVGLLQHRYLLVRDIRWITAEKRKSVERLIPPSYVRSSTAYKFDTKQIMECFLGFVEKAMVAAIRRLVAFVNLVGLQSSQNNPYKRCMHAFERIFRDLFPVGSMTWQRNKEGKHLGPFAVLVAGCIVFLSKEDCRVCQSITSFSRVFLGVYARERRMVAQRFCSLELATI